MDMGYYQKLRVLRHELGHWFAHEYNKQYYGGNGTEKITITRKEIYNQNFDYEGSAHLKDYNKESVLEHPASLIASMAYGCIFQCILYSDPLDSCLAPGAKHGFKDFDQIFSVNHCLTGSREGRANLLDTIGRHFARIKGNPEFKQMEDINVDDLIESEEEKFDIDLNEIENRFGSFLDQHCEYYQMLVSELDKYFVAS